MRNEAVEEAPGLSLRPAMFLRLGELFLEVFLSFFVCFIIVVEVRWRVLVLSLMIRRVVNERRGYNAMMGGERLMGGSI